MSTEQTLAAAEPFVLADREGTHLHFLNHLATIKVAGGPTSSMSVVEFTGLRGFGPPLHNHLEEDELFIVLDGELEFHTGDERIVGGPGSMAFLPHNRPHTFQVLSETANFVNVTSSATTTPRFDRMVAALGVVTDDPSMPEPSPIDPGRVAEICSANGIEILGPPPAPLD
ncbi:MAG: cupin domain-containing protein [Acidimicrobiia bacterium]|nr:cupin domain-containing protein [Acidimicrobiia bacterium]